MRSRAAPWIARALDELVRRQVIDPFDHRNLNVEIEAFHDAVPTSENLGLEIARRLKQNWHDSVSGALAPAGKDPHHRNAAEHLSSVCR